MSRADQLRAKQERLRAAAEQVGAATPAQSTSSRLPPVESIPARPTPRSVTTPLVKDVRITVDLSPARYRDLQSWLNESATRLGRSRVTKQDALSALVGILLTDERLARMVLTEIQSSQ